MLRPVAALALCLAAGAAGAVETVRIAIGPAEDRVVIRGEGLAYGMDSDDAALVASTERTVTVRNVKGRLYLDGAPWMGEAIRFRAGEEQRDAGVPGEQPISAGPVEVRGDVVVRARGGRLLLINVVTLEDYLAAVLGSEMPHSFPDEALKAQAVAARTYALYKKLGAYGAEVHMGSSVLHQVYAGVASEDARTRAAVEATRGEVLTHELAPIEAYFHASCGGQTESGAAALVRDLPYLQPVSCPCGTLPVTQWSLKLSREELGSLFAGADRITVSSRTSTGRARRISLGNEEIDAVKFRERAGYTRVKSLLFDVETAPEGFVLRGKGSGHGAGLCQWGAKVLADQGMGYREILERYYPGTELQTLY